MLTNSTHYAFISAHYAHIMLEYPNRITGQENNYSNYLTFIILQHEGKFNVVLYGMVLDLGFLGWNGFWGRVSTSPYISLSAVTL